MARASGRSKMTQTLGKTRGIERELMRRLASHVRECSPDKSPSEVEREARALYDGPAPVGGLGPAGIHRRLKRKRLIMADIEAHR